MTHAVDRLPLALLATALAGLAGAELLAAGPAGAPLGHHALRLPRSPKVVADAAAQPRSTQDAQAILARPLFRPDRRPPSVKAAPSIAATLPRLSGILIGRGFRLALFAVGSGKTRIVAQGGRIAGYRIVAIDPASVVLDGAGGRRVLTPHFEMTAGSPKASASAPAASLTRPGPGAAERR